MKKVLLIILLFVLTCVCFSYDFESLQGHTTKKIKKQTHILFYSALWCSACQEITPSLIKFYNKYKQKYDFEIILVSLDFTEQQLWDHIYTDKIPFTVIKFNYLKQSNTYQYAGNIMPWITVFDKDGKKIFSHKLTKKSLKYLRNKL